MSRTREALKRIVIDRVVVEITDEMIDSGQQFKEVGVDSLDSIEVLVVMEDELDIELSDERLEKSYKHERTGRVSQNSTNEN